MVTQWIPGDKHRASKLAASATTNSCFLGSLAPQIQKLWTTTSQLSLSENQGSIENLQWQSIFFLMDSHAILPDCWGIEVDVSTKLGQEDIPEWFGICNLIVVPRSKKKVLFKNQHFFPGMVWKTTLRTWCFTWSLVTTPSGLPSAQLCPDDPPESRWLGPGIGHIGPWEPWDPGWLRFISPEWDLWTIWSLVKNRPRFAPKIHRSNIYAVYAWGDSLYSRDEYQPLGRTCGASIDGHQNSLQKIKNKGDLSIKQMDFSLELGDLSIKHGDFIIKLRISSKIWGFHSEMRDLTIRHGDLNGDGSC